MRSLAIDSSLAGIAGEPLAVNSSPNTIVATTLSSLSKRTMYCVGSFESGIVDKPIAALDNGGVFVNNGVGIVVRAPGTSTNNGVAYRLQTAGVNMVVLSNNDVPRNKLQCYSVSWDGNKFYCHAYGYATITSGDYPQGFPENAGLRLVNDAGAKGVVSICYNNFHDYFTRIRIMSYLSGKYANYF